VFFALESGRQPVRDWLKNELTLEQRTEIGSDIRDVEYGWRWECRRFGKLNRTCGKFGAISRKASRGSFYRAIRRMILLHRYIKKSQKAPEKHLDVARKRLAVVKRAMHEHKTAYVGDDLDSFLKEEGIYDEVCRRSAKKRLTQQLMAHMKKHHVTKSALAKK